VIEFADSRELVEKSSVMYGKTVKKSLIVIYSY
jgi:hypothetical protein